MKCLQKYSGSARENVITYLLEDTNFCKISACDEKIARVLQVKTAKLTAQIKKTKKIRMKLRLQLLWENIVNQSLIIHDQELDKINRSAIMIQKYSRGWLARINSSVKYITKKSSELTNRLTTLKSHANFCILSLGNSAFSVNY